MSAQMEQACEFCHVRHYYGSDAYKRCQIRKARGENLGNLAVAKNPVGDIVSDETENLLGVEDVDEILDSYIDPTDEQLPEGESKKFDDFFDEYQGRAEGIRERLEDLKENGTPEELAEYARSIATSQEYADLEETKHSEKKRAGRLGYKVKGINYKMSDALDRGEEFDLEEAREIYELSQQKQEAFDNAGTAGVLLDEYNKLAEEALQASFEKRGGDGDGTITIVDDDKVGKFELLSDHDPSSDEWAEDYASAMSVDDIEVVANEFTKVFDKDGNEVFKTDRDGNVMEDYNGNPKKQFYFNADNYTERRAIWGSKTGLEDPVYGDDKERVAFIGEMAAKRDDLNLIRRPGILKNPESGITINGEYFLTSDGETPEGVLNITTDDDASRWGKESLGIDGVPASVRAKAIVSAREGGFDKGSIGVLLNGKDLRVYHFDMNEELEKEAKKNVDRAKTIMDNVQEAKKEGNANYNQVSFGAKPWGGDIRPLGKYGYETEGWKGEKAEKERAKLFRDVALLRTGDVNKEEMAKMKKEFESYLPEDKKEWTPDSMDKAVEKMIAKSAGGFRNLESIRGVDIEATGLPDGSVQVLEVGVSRLNTRTGEMIDEYSELYDIPRQHKIYKGTGADNVHGIGLNDIVGKRDIKDPQVQADILAEMKKDGGLHIAHYSDYERGVLRGAIEGFAEAEARGEIKFFDSRNLSIYGLYGITKGNALKDLAEANGVPYVDAHRSTTDVRMMLSASHNFFGGMFGGNKYMQDVVAGRS